ncbi:MAG: hypothetical protein WAL50_08555 [Kineosporiaceae bacterium]|jgi:phenylacetate-CoA ligase
MSGLKRAALDRIPRLPNTVNRGLLALNRDPVLAFGRSYGAYRDLLARNHTQYDATEALLAAVNRALTEVPFYRRYRADGEIRSIEEFEQRIGFTDRDLVGERWSQFTAAGTDLSRYERITTGGTSGKPLELLAPRDRHVIELATMHALWGRAGYDFDVRAVMRNHRLGSGKLFTVNPVTRELIFDGFRLDPDYFAAVYDVIVGHGIRFIHCYPSTAHEFATFVVESGRDLSGVEAFLSGSENVFPHQRELIENRLGVRFYTWYGHTEKLVLAGECARSTDYHVEPTYGYFELVDDDGEVIREPGRVGEIVGTALHNPGMPLIRYRTGDVAEYVGDHCPHCDRRLPLIRNIRGRWAGDRVYNADGTFVTTTALNLHNDLYRVIHGLQYVQEAKGELNVLVVKSPDFRERHERALTEHFRGRLAADTRIDIRYVDRLIRKENGKFVHIISAVADR